MSNRNSYTRTRTTNFPRGSGGPYEAIVVNHLDPMYMGTLQVELLKANGSGNNPERTGQVVTVKYLSPFYGVTPELATSRNDGYEYTQKSYGMWMIPPDVGTKVLVIFAQDNSAYGYWIGCIQDTAMNFMLPDGKASTKFHTPITPNPLKPYKLPVGEFNKKIETGEGRDPTKFLKPWNKDFTQILETQGLLEDEIRGTTTTSARREVPSMVFGVSTPGPLDKRNGAPQFDYGNQKSKASQWFNRLGGSSFVMDDGDDKFLRKTHAEDGPPEYANAEKGETDGDPTIPHNELVRLRTRTGHQILLHNSEDLIYIGNSRGTAWIEITSDGKIDIHADDSISIMTGADLNITAERDINMEAGRNINMKATARYSGGEQFDINSNESGRIQVESIWNTNIDVGNDYKLTVHNNSDTVVDKVKKVLVKDNYHFHTNKNRYQRSDQATHEESGFSWYRESESNINDLAAGIVAIDAGGGGGPDIHLNSNLASPADSPEDAVPVVHLSTISLPYTMPGETDPAYYESILCRAPQHEPWIMHENMNPLAYKTENTDRESPGPLTSAPFEPLTPDTFAKGSGQHSSIGSGSGGSSASSAGSNQSAGLSSSSAQAGTGVDQAASAPNVAPNIGDPLSTNDLVGNIDGFTPEQTAAYLGAVGQRESGNNYSAVNSFGYAGKYQFGTPALKEAGLIRMDAPNSNSAMNDPANWTGQYGVNSLEDWLTNENAQENAMITYTNRNLGYLRNNGGIRAGDTQEQIGGMLAGSHLLGAGGMNNWRRGNGGVDGYGTTGEEYFALGSTAMRNAGLG